MQIIFFQKMKISLVKYLDKYIKKETAFIKNFQLIIPPVDGSLHLVGTWK